MSEFFVQPNFPPNYCLSQLGGGVLEKKEEISFSIGGGQGDPFWNMPSKAHEGFHFFCDR